MLLCRLPPISKYRKSKLFCTAFRRYVNNTKIMYCTYTRTSMYAKPMQKKLCFWLFKFTVGTLLVPLCYKTLPAKKLVFSRLAILHY